MSVKLARILIVDDEKDICNIIAKGLRIAGFDADGIVGAANVLSRYKAGMYDLIILDIKMPEIDGIELYARIKSMDKDARICFLSAFDSSVITQFKARFPYAEVPHLIRKPVELSKLIQTVKEQLSV